MKKTIIQTSLIAGAIAFSLTSCEVEQTKQMELPTVDVDTEPGNLPDVDVVVKEEGKLPEVDVDVKGGQLPAFDVDAPEVDVKMKKKTIEIEVPEVEVTMPDEQRKKSDAQPDNQ